MTVNLILKMQRKNFIRQDEFFLKRLTQSKNML
jgi:hypothetical protein